MKKQYLSTWESVKTHPVPAWYEDCKFGIFIHWGIYSVPAFAPRTWELGEIEANEDWFCNNPYAEWYYNSINVGRGPSYEYHISTYGKDFTYDDFIPMWKAENWDPAAWAALFREAGAGYVVLTTKHHDGFCLFDSRYTDYSSSKMGPKTDITGRLTEAVRAEGLRMGLYYSGLIDWQYANDPIYTEEQLFSTACPTAAYADYSYNQMKELIDRYHPSVLWNDIGWPKQSEQAMPYLLSHYFNTVEDGVVNDRFNGLYHDYLTKEYQQGEMHTDEKWEMCRGLGLSFGYNANEGDDQLISCDGLVRLLVEVVANNGNLLLNIGPKADGTIPEEQAKRLRVLGKWLSVNGEGIYGTRFVRKSVYEDGLEYHFTGKDDRAYLFIHGLQEGESRIVVPGVKEPVQPLDPALSVSCVKTGGGIILTIRNYRKDMYTAGFRTGVL
ncbi:MAG: alpha-L-fucosidase [Blautia sp.]|nr:alpha-L-fucosidase [Blautia sp.]